MNRLFDDMFNVLEAATRLDAYDRVAPRRSYDTRYPASVDETDGAYEVSLVVPGIPRDEIDVEVTGRRLNVSYEAGEKTRARLGYRSFRRSWELPGDADLERIGADHRDGVLTVRVPKLDSVSRTRKIAIEGSS